MPAPTRYIVSRDEPVDEADIVDVSEWHQPPNRQAPASFGPLGPPPDGWPAAANWFNSYKEKPGDPPYPADYEGWVNEAAVVMVSETTTGPITESGIGTVPGSAAFFGEYANGGFGPPTGIYYERKSAVKAVKMLNDYPYVLQPVDSCWKEEWQQEDWPDGAIGYEVEQAELDSDFWLPISMPVSASVVGTMDGQVTAGVIGGTEALFQIQKVWKSTGTIRFVFREEFNGWVAEPQGSGSLGPNSRSIEETYIEPINYVQRTIPADGLPMPTEEFDFTITEFAPEYPRMAMFSTWISVRNGLVLSGSPVYVYANANAGVVYTIRPPRFRWLYNEETSGEAPVGRTEPTRVRFF